MKLEICVVFCFCFLSVQECWSLIWFVDSGSNQWLVFEHYSWTEHISLQKKKKIVVHAFCQFPHLVFLLIVTNSVLFFLCSYSQRIFPFHFDQCLLFLRFYFSFFFKISFVNNTLAHKSGPSKSTSICFTNL